MAEREGGVGVADATPAPTWEELTQRSRALQERLAADPREEDTFSVLDPMLANRLFVRVAESVLADPEGVVAAQQRLLAEYTRLWEWTRAAAAGQRLPPVIEPARDDRRFKDEGWQSNPVFDAIKQYYLLTSRWCHDLLDRADLDAADKRRAQFYLRQLLSAMSPSNFVATNPRVLRTTVESEGENLRRGMNNLLDDVERGRGRLRVSLTDESAFELGRDLATTPGKVVYQNDLVQLIQYAPTTERVRRRPLLIVPPWINKYYVLDLQPKNSFVRWAIGQGHTVFLISWVNPDQHLAWAGFDDYLRRGPLAALDAVRAATGEAEVNAVGYCIGGTLLACTLAHLAATGDDRVRSATFLTTMLDFAEPGELGVFIDEEQLAALERHLDARGCLEGGHMADVFSLLRENDLVWSPFVNNYLLGRTPPAFDLLYWNADSTRMPAMMHKFYLREMYQNNRLVQPDALVIAGTPIDLRRIRVPAYLLSTREDHIAPWRSTFAATRLFSGPVRFVLAASGHIAGVINPPGGGKYGHWVNPRRPASPDRWLALAQLVEGSWWPDWARWLGRFSGGTVPARSPGSGDLSILEDAPGSYVRARSA